MGSMVLKDVRKVLIVNLGGIGDLLLSLVAVAALRGAYGSATVDAMVVDRAREAAARSGLFNEVYAYKGGIAEKISLLNRLRGKRYDLAINMRTMTSALGALKIRIILGAIGGRICAGRDTDGLGKFFDISVPETLQGEKYEMEYDIDIVEKLGATVAGRKIPYRIDQAESERALAALKKAGISPDDIVVGIHPGGKPSHRWPAENYAMLMKRLSLARPCSFIITGDAEESALADALIKAAGVKAANMSGKLTLGELGEAIRRCDLFISNDTAAMHIAAILDVPLIAIFGPGFLARFDPRNISSNAKVFYKEAPCAPCNKRSCGSLACLKEISPQDVADAALGMLEERGRERC